ncbi:MAG: oligosaccharide flippase family protein [Candidatus Vogelbacteria bacterium]|nr:oligosaccharide flippase family protein [Candidatus Vogelbacteria bacterium]
MCVLALGAKDYGIYIFINAIVGMLTLLDLGVTMAIVKYLAEYQGQEDSDKTRRLLYSANSIFLIIGSGGFLLSLLIAGTGHWLFPARIAGFGSYYVTLFLLAGLTFFVSSVVNLYAIIPDALQRYDISAKLSVSYLTISALSNLAVVLLGFKLTAIFTVQLTLTILFSVWRYYAAKKIMPDAKYHLSWDQEAVKNCYRYGLATVMNSTASTSLAYLDRLIIPIFVGPTQLTYYSLPGNVAARIPGVTDNLSGIIFPVSANLSGAGDKERIKRFYVRSVRLVFLLAFALSVSVILLAKEILRNWLSADFAEKSSEILIILTLTSFVIALLSPITSFFFGLGKIKFSSILSISMAILNAIALFVLLPRWGILGAAWAYLLSVLPIFYMIYFIENKYLHLTHRLKYHATQIIKALAVTVIFYPLIRLFIAPLITNLGLLILLGPTSVVIFFVLYWLFGFFEPEDRHDLNRFVQLMISRLLGIFRPHKRTMAQ